jgi:predicted AAA+ superfamily ATPase
MDMYPRILNPLKSKSFFLFGARGTGKTTYLKSIFEGRYVLWIDFLKSSTEEQFSRNPELLFDIAMSAAPEYEWIIIDEIQKIPKILDTIHLILESKKIKTKFILTGSSARKLKRGSANLLAGRVFSNHFFPFTFIELGKDFDLEKAINYGMLPTVWVSENEEEIREYLKSYVEVYVKEEIWLEQLIKSLAPFRKFLEVASQMSGEIINYSNIAKQINVDVKTVQNYFLILEDTLLAFNLEAYHSSIRKRLISAPKFYFFDLGVKRALERTLNLKIEAHNFTYGKNFEQFIITQIFFLNSHLKCDFKFYYLKTKDGVEIDLIIDRANLPLILIEIKSTSTIDSTHLKSIKEIKSSLPGSLAFCFSNDIFDREIDQIKVTNWKNGILELFPQLKNQNASQLKS